MADTNLTTGYEHLGWVNHKFWSNYTEDNENHVLYCILNTWVFDAPLHAINKFARTCKSFFSILQWKLTKSRAIAAKWIRPAVRKYPNWALNTLQPIKYTGRATKYVPIDDAIAVNQLGVCPIDTEHEIFTPEDANTVFALSNIHLVARQPVECLCILFVNLQPVCSAQVLQQNFVKYGSEYIVNLNLLTQNNPILLAAVPVSKITLCIARRYISFSDTEDTILEFDFDFMLANFTQIISSFKTISAASHDWSKYEFVCNGDIDQYVKFAPLSQKKYEVD
jgi:hypothetical protein